MKILNIIGKGLGRTKCLHDEWSVPIEIGVYAEDLIAGTGRIDYQQHCLGCGKTKTWSESSV